MGRRVKRLLTKKKAKEKIKMINKIKNKAIEIKDAALSALFTFKQMLLAQGHMQDYMVLGTVLAAGIAIGSCL